MNKLYFRDFKLNPPHAPDNQKPMLMAVKRTNLDDLTLCTCIYDKNKNDYFECTTDNKLNMLATTDIVMWMPLQDYKDIEVNFSHGTLKEFITYYSVRGYSHFDFTIKKQRYNCNDYSDFLFKYGTINDGLLDHYEVASYSITDSVVGRVPTYHLSVRKRK